MGDTPRTKCETIRDTGALQGVNAVEHDVAAVPSQADEALLDAVARGDHTAFATIYERHVRTVFRFALSLGISPRDVEDVTQEVFVVAFKKAARIRTADGSALPWLMVTCRNLSYAHLRKRAKDHAHIDAGEHDVADPTASPESRALQAELSLTIAEAIGRLSPRDQKLVHLCLDRGMTYRQAAHALGVTDGTVRNRLSRARAELRSSLRGAFREQGS